MKAEQQFVTLITATMSHELRNPLNSLIGQVCQIETNLDSFIQFKESLKAGMMLTNEEITILDGICTCFKICGQKVDSATKQIDFYVQNVLDYTLLTKNEGEFSKRMEVFNLDKSIQEII